MLTTVALCLAAFLAGLVDAVVGGGGLIQVPALLIAFPQTPPAMLLGTNRTSSIFGTTVAMLRYVRETRVPWRTMLPTALVASACSYLGSRAVTHANPLAFKPVIIVILVIVAVYTYVRKDFGRLHAPKLGPRAQLGLSLLIGAVLGFYDGFFGPGTGSFLIFAFVGLLGFSFVAASASAKVINVATNLSSFYYFMTTGNVLLPLGFLMAGCNVLGAAAGAHLALTRGSGFVRRLFLLIVPVLIARFAWDVWAGR